MAASAGISSDGISITSISAGSVQGSVEGVEYTFTLTVSKGERSDEERTTVTVKQGAPPLPSIAPVIGKVNPAQKLVLSSSVRLGHSDGNESAVWLQWSIAAVAGTPALDLTEPSVLASQSLGGTEVVLQPDCLTPGGSYDVVLTATAEGTGSYGSASLRFFVNERPQEGALAVAPSEGVSLQTVFALNTSGWVDEDPPLDFLFVYVLVDVNGTISPEVALSEFGPKSAVTLTLPEAGLEEAGWRVEVRVYARDRYGAVGGPWAVAVTVTAPILESEAEVVSLSQEVLTGGSSALENGDVDSAMNSVTGAASLLSAPARRRRLLRRRLHQEVETGEAGEAEAQAESERRAQREDMVRLVSSARSMMAATETAQERVASLVSRIVDCDASEVSPGTQDSAMGVMESVVSSALADVSTGASKLSTATASQVLGGLSSLVGNGSDVEASARTQAIMQQAVDALLQSAVSGELPVQVSSDGLQLCTQRDTLTGPGATGGRLFQHPLAISDTDVSTPTVTFPTALQSALTSAGHSAVELRLLAMDADPHSTANASANSTGAAGARERAAPGNGSSVTWRSPVVTVTFEDAGAELEVQNLTEPIALNLTVEAEQHTRRTAEDLPLACSFWDEARGKYSTAGCATLPNPAPPGAWLYWRPQVWGALTSGDAGGIGDEELLAASWGVGHAWLLSNCSEEYDAVDSIDGGEKAARTYRGEACAMADPLNNMSCAWNWTSQGFMGT
eukprot:gene20531-24608_t